VTLPAWSVTWPTHYISDGADEMQMLCHCTDCRKTSGATYSNNFIVPSANLKITKGTPKEISKIADSGKPITNCFCPDCGKLSSSFCFQIGSRLESGRR